MGTKSEFRDRDYWIVENSLYIEPSFRLQKIANLVNRHAGDRESTLLDVGCGPAALQPLLKSNVSYFGIDIAIHRPAANLREIDASRAPIAFEGRRFDFVTALGFFEYMGPQQDQKLLEIRAALKPTGELLMTYINFSHYRKAVWPNYNNVRSIAQMRASLAEVFQIEQCFPASHHWRQKQPGKNALSGLQMHLNRNIPVLSRFLAVEYLFVCSQQQDPNRSGGS